jgi:hypothetical protein
MRNPREWLICLVGGIFVIACGCLGKQGIKEADVNESEKKVTIEATATVSDTHPEIEEGITCADCHEVLLDGTTRATETWLYNDYLNFSAGEGLESNEATTPLATTFDAAIDPEKMAIYIFSEKGTEKIYHMRNNPRVSIGWHREFTQFGKTLCIQMLGTAEVIDDPAQYGAGLATYPYEEIADVRKMDHKKFADEVMKQFMTMTKVTINQIIITDSQYAREKGVRVHQLWQRKE